MQVFYMSDTVKTAVALSESVSLPYTSTFERSATNVSLGFDFTFGCKAKK